MVSIARAAPGRPRPPLRVVILAACGDALIDVLGPYQVFLQASKEGGALQGEEQGRYTVEILSTGAEKTVRSPAGIGILCTGTLERFTARVDTLMIAGSDLVHETHTDPRVVAWIARQGARARRVASVCSGAFLLAEAGLLDGRRATTHWRYASRLAAMYPRITVDPDPIYVRDGNIYTSAGMTSGMDLSLALVEEDFGPQVALGVARSLVIYLRRPGGQSQFSAALRRQTPDGSPVKRAQAWIAEHIGERMPVEQLAGIAGMSPRNFARVFTRDTGVTPAKYVDELRLEEARRLLQESGETIETVAHACGFGSVDSLQRNFLGAFGTTPVEYRSHFATTIRQERIAR